MPIPPILLLMNSAKNVGIFLFQKERQEHAVLKDLIRLVRTQTPGRTPGFSYVEAETSLIPQLSLWENLQLEAGGSSWKEFCEQAKTEHGSLLNLIQNPELMAQKASPWERFTVSLVKGLLRDSPHILIDLNEEILSPFMIRNMKKLFIGSETKSIYVASAQSALWLDCAHSLVLRHHYEFETLELDREKLRTHWAA